MTLHMMLVMSANKKRGAEHANGKKVAHPTNPHMRGPQVLLLHKLSCT